jgi:hypothetical protein
VTGATGPEGKLGLETVLTENLKKEAVTGEKIANEAVAAPQIKKEAVTNEKISPALKKVIPLAVGRSAAMTLGKITISSSAVTATGPIIVSAEGSPVGVSVTSRAVGESFTVEATVPTSTARVNWAVYSE